MQLEDGNTFNYGYIGSRATGNDAGDYMVVGPDWKGDTPPGIKKVFRSSTQFSIAGYRTQLFGPDDIDNVKKVQAGYKVQPLSAYLGQLAPPAAPTVDFPKIDKELVKSNFFEYLDFALQFAPPGADEKDIRAKLAKIGVGAGKRFDFHELPLRHSLEIGLGMKQGDKKVDQYLATAAKDINGWKIGSWFGDRAFFNGNWLLRAAGAKGGIYGNDAVEATYPMTRNDVDGQPLDGSKAKYTVTFAKGQLPPVNAFWSVTMYDGKTQLLIKNPIDRYLINSPMVPDLKKNADGSLTLYIQKDEPPTRTKKPTGCRRRTARSISPCAPIGRRRRHPPSCRLAKALGSHRRSSGRSRATRPRQQCSNAGRLRSVLGHEPTSRLVRVAPALPPKADIHQRGFARPLGAKGRHHWTAPVQNPTLFHERDRKLGEVNDLSCNRPHDEIGDRTHAACSHHNPFAGQGFGA